MAKVFISYRNADSVSAVRLAQDIKDAGHSVWIGDWDVQVGDSIIQFMNDGLSGAVYVVVCYSDDGILSPWMGREWKSALAQQLNGKPVKILPVRLTGGEPPAILADMKYVDLVQDWSSGVGALLRVIV